MASKVAPVVYSRLILGSAARRKKLLASTEDNIEAMWRMTDPYDPGQVIDFADKAGKASVAAQRAAISITTAAQLRFLRELGQDLKFTPTVPDEVRYFGERESAEAEPVDLVVRGQRSQRVSVQEAFMRPARQFRYDMANGASYAEALESSAKRAKIIAGTNVSLSEREAQDQILDEAHVKNLQVIGYRRIIHPEVSESGTCGLCLAASDRIYHRGDINPLHDHCACTVMPITSDGDPGNDINREDMNRIYDDAGGTAAQMLKRTRYKIDDHGELRAVLVPAIRGAKVQHYSTTGGSAPAVNLDDTSAEVEMATRMLPRMQKLLDQSMTKGLDERSDVVMYQSGQVARYKRILGI